MSTHAHQSFLAGECRRLRSEVDRLQEALEIAGHEFANAGKLCETRRDERDKARRDRDYAQTYARDLENAYWGEGLRISDLTTERDQAREELDEMERDRNSARRERDDAKREVYYLQQNRR